MSVVRSKVFESWLQGSPAVGDALRELGFDTARRVAIDDDWSALRFRSVEYIERPK